MELHKVGVDKNDSLHVIHEEGIDNVSKQDHVFVKVQWAEIRISWT